MTRVLELPVLGGPAAAARLVKTRLLVVLAALGGREIAAAAALEMRRKRLVLRAVAVAVRGDQEAQALRVRVEVPQAAAEGRALVSQYRALLSPTPEAVVVAR